MAKQIIIRVVDGEYQVPTDGGTFFTFDRGEALAVCRTVYGARAIRIVRMGN